MNGKTIITKQVTRIYSNDSIDIQIIETQYYNKILSSLEIQNGIIDKQIWMNESNDKLNSECNAEKIIKINEVQNMLERFKKEQHLTIKKNVIQEILDYIKE